MAAVWRRAWPALKRASVSIKLFPRLNKLDFITVLIKVSIMSDKWYPLDPGNAGIQQIRPSKLAENIIKSQFPHLNKKRLCNLIKLCICDKQWSVPKCRQTGTFLTVAPRLRSVKLEKD